MSKPKPHKQSGRDPFRRRSRISEPVARGFAALALLSGLIYLGWRIADTSQGVPMWLWAPLVVGEVLGWIDFAFFAHRTWRAPATGRTESTVRHKVDVFIATYNDPIPSIRATLIGCGGLAQSHTTWVLDDGNRPDVAALAAEHGAEYIARTSTADARAGNINHALAMTDGDLILVLAPGDIPMPDLLTASLGHFDDDDVAAVVLGTAEADGISDARHRAHQPKALELEVVGPSLAEINATPWDGGPALIRRHALRQVGDMAIGTLSTEYQTAIRMQAAGWRVKYHAQALAETLPVRNLQARLALRDRRSRGVLQAFRSPSSPLRTPGLDLRQRLAYLGDAYKIMMSIQRLTMIAVLIAVLATAKMPFSAPATTLAAAWLPWFVLAGIARFALGRGRLEPAELLRRDLRNMSVDLSALSALFSGPQHYRFAPKVGDTGGVRGAISQLRLLSLLFIAVDLAVLYRVADVGFGSEPALDGRPFAAAVVVAVWVLGSMIWVLHTAASSRSRRINYRRPVAIAATLRGAMIRVLDLVPDGIGFETGMPLRTGERATVRVQLPDEAGSVHEVALSGQVIWALQVSTSGTWRAGMKFDELRPIERDRVVEFCSVTLPYNELRRGGLREAVVDTAA